MSGAIQALLVAVLLPLNVSALTEKEAQKFRDLQLRLSILEKPIINRPCDLSEKGNPGAVAIERKVKEVGDQVGDMYEKHGLPRPRPKMEKDGKSLGLGMELPGFSTGGGLFPYDVELIARLSELQPNIRTIFGIGNAFGLSTLTLARLFPLATVDVMDAEVEGRNNSAGSSVTRAIASENGLRVNVHQGFSPRDVPAIMDKLNIQRGGRAIDLAFIDGRHTDSQQVADFVALAGYMNQTEHTFVLHDVLPQRFRGGMGDSLRFLVSSYGHKTNLHVCEYGPLNWCNMLGTHFATTSSTVATTMGVKKTNWTRCWH